MKQKRTFTSLLCLLLVTLTLLCACGKKDPAGTGTPPSGNDGTKTEESSPIIELLPANKYTEEFVILTREGYNNGQYLVFHEEDGDPLNKVSVERTLYLEEHYGIDMVINEQEHLVTVLENATLNNSGEYDLVGPHPTDGIVKLMTSGCFANLLETPYQFTEREWWNQSQVENYTTNGKLYLGVSDLTITSQSLLALVYNRDRYAALGLTDNLYDVVNAGGFTMEYLNTLLTQCKSDQDGDFDPNTAEYGLLFQTNSSRRWMYALGQRILTKNTDGVFELSLKSEPLVTLCSSMYSLLYESGDVLVAATGANATFASSDFWKTFTEKRALFVTFNVGSLYPLLRNLDFDIGYLPLPKLDDGQRDYLVVEASGFITIPATANNMEMSSVILEALSIYSYTEMRPAFFNAILYGRLSENPEDYKMLEFLHGAKFYDIGFTLDSSSVALGAINTYVVDKKAPDSAANLLVGKRNELKALVTQANTIQ